MEPSPVTHDGVRPIRLYVKLGGSRVARPLQEPKAFRRVHLAAGARERVELPLRAADLGCWDQEKKGFTVETGTLEIRVGSSSADIRLTKKITIAD